MPSAGIKNRRLSFQSRPTVDDGLGNKEGDDWVERFQCSAYVRPLRGSETVIASRLQGVQPVTITVWKSWATNQITTGWRAVNALTAVSYNIRTVADVTGKNIELEMMAEAGGPVG